MNTILNLGSMAASTGLLAAGLIFAYGVWLGRRETGWRAAQGVLAAVVLGGVLPFLVIHWFPALLSYDSRNLASLFLTAALNIVGVLVAFLPWLVAVNWLEVLRREDPRA